MPDKKFVKKPLIVLFCIVAVLSAILFFKNTRNSSGTTGYLTAIKRGGEWFLNNENKDFIYYEYDYIHKKHTENKHYLREMGSLWSIAKLSTFLEDGRYEKLAKKGFAYFEQFFIHDKKKNIRYVEPKTGDSKLGYSAFIIMTLLEMDHLKKTEYLQSFANGIMALQETSGELKTFFYSAKDTGKDYYPGEALLALSKLYLYSHDKKYLETVERALPFYMDYFRSNPNTAFVPWQTQAYAVLYKERKDKDVASFIFEMNDFIINSYVPKKECSDFTIGKGSTVAIYVEGVNKAYEVAKQTGDKHRALCYKTFIKEATEVIIQSQIYGGGDKQSDGGFVPSGSSQMMRADRNQHAVMSLIGSYEAGL